MPPPQSASKDAAAAAAAAAALASSKSLRSDGGSEQQRQARFEEALRLIATTPADLPVNPDAVDIAACRLRPSEMVEVFAGRMMNPNSDWGLTVNLSGSHIGPQRCVSIGRSMVLSRCIVSLDLSWCDLQPAACIELCQLLCRHFSNAIVVNRTNQQLDDVANSHINLPARRRQEADVSGRTMSNRGTLKHVNLSGNPLRCEWVYAGNPLPALTTWSTLASMQSGTHFNGSSIGQTGTSAAAAANVIAAKNSDVGDSSDIVSYILAHSPAPTEEEGMALPTQASAVCCAAYNNAFSRITDSKRITAAPVSMVSGHVSLPAITDIAGRPSMYTRSSTGVRVSKGGGPTFALRDGDSGNGTSPQRSVSGGQSPASPRGGSQLSKQPLSGRQSGGASNGTLAEDIQFSVLPFRYGDGTVSQNLTPAKAAAAAATTTEDVIAALAALLPYLESLQVAWSELGDSCAVAFSKAIRDSDSIHFLDLRGNGVTAYGAMSLLEAIDPCLRPPPPSRSALTSASSKKGGKKGAGKKADAPSVVVPSSPVDPPLQRVSDDVRAEYVRCRDLEKLRLRRLQRWQALQLRPPSAPRASQPPPNVAEPGQPTLHRTQSQRHGSGPPRGVNRSLSKDEPHPPNLSRRLPSERALRPTSHSSAGTAGEREGSTTQSTMPTPVRFSFAAVQGDNASQQADDDDSSDGETTESTIRQNARSRTLQDLAVSNVEMTDTAMDDKALGTDTEPSPVSKRCNMTLDALWLGTDGKIPRALLDEINDVLAMRVPHPSPEMTAAIAKLKKKERDAADALEQNGGGKGKGNAAAKKKGG